MAHDAGVMRSYGKEVSLAEAQPGDLVCYYGHVGIYIGGGQIVHAVNERLGIAVTLSLIHIYYRRRFRPYGRLPRGSAGRIFSQICRGRLQ